MLATLPEIGFCYLHDLSLVAVRGPDAATFLHQQLSNAVTGMPAHTFRLAGLCSPKGRLFASMYYWREQDDIILMVSRDLSEPLIKRLSMFILRSRVTLTNVDSHYTLLALVGKETVLAQALSAALPDVGGIVHHPKGAVLRLPDVQGHCRLLWPMPASTVPQSEDKHALSAGVNASGVNACLADYPGRAIAQEIALPIWHALEIHSGVPRITLATQDQFVPQMINFEVVGGVDFKKGCYPGQEIVARSQYRGTIKRRLQLACVEGDVMAIAGTLLFHSDDPGQPCGMVVNAVQTGSAASYDILVEVKLAALTSGTVHLHDAAGPVLTFLSLPYSLAAAE